MEVAIMKQARKTDPDVLFTVERRTVIGQVFDGEGNMPPIAAGFMLAAQALEVAFDAAFSARGYGESDEPTHPSVEDTLTFDWQGHTFTIDARPTDG
jgi:hypothetical protein